MPAILVPLPTAAEDHQTMNARALSDNGAAMLVPDAETIERLGPAIVDLVRDADAREHLVAHIAGMGRPDAAAAIAAEVVRTARP